MGDPDHVPAGIYGKKALERLNVWESVSSKIARTGDVRAALTLVENGESPLGIVYATDAAISKRVKIVGMFPDICHPRIAYPAAIVVDQRNPLSMTFLNFLKSPDAAVIFKTYGFMVIH
jgi:molybdate transport system substrate-binding protein